MKNTHCRHIIIFLLLSMLLVLLSCSTFRKSALSCPRIPDAKFNYKTRHETNNKRDYNLFALKRPAKCKHAYLIDAAITAKEINKKGDKRRGYFIDRISIDKNEYLTGLTASIDNNILGTNHNQVTASFAIKRSKTVKSLYYSSVTQASRDAMATTIKYAEGNNGLFNDADQSENIFSADEKQIEGLGVAGFAIGIAGIFVLGWLFGFIGVIFGIISLVRMKKNPDKYKSKWYAIASIILGIFDITLILVLLL